MSSAVLQIKKGAEMKTSELKEIGRIMSTYAERLGRISADTNESREVFMTMLERGETLDTNVEDRALLASTDARIVSVRNGGELTSSYFDALVDFAKNEIVGYRTPRAAFAKAREVSTNPMIVELANGTWAAKSDTHVTHNGQRYAVLFLPRKNTVYAF